MKRRVLIVGSRGQDGKLLCQDLVSQGCEVLGLGRGTAQNPDTARPFLPVRIESFQEVLSVVSDFKPDEIYYLAAYHHSAEDALPSDAELFQRGYEVNAMGVIHFLESILKSQLPTRLFYAGSSHVFGQPDTEVQDESTAFRPINPYGMTKLAGLLACRYYREQRGVFASVGIMYNHESEFRARNFLSMRIIETALEILSGKTNELVVGNLSAVVDWGYASDFVQAMQKTLRVEKPQDFIVATGKPKTVRDFVEETFDLLGLALEGRVREDKTLIKKQTMPLVGNPSKLRQVTGWEPSVDFRGMIKAILKAKGAKTRE